MNIYLSNLFNYTVLSTQNLKKRLTYKNIAINLHLMSWTKKYNIMAVKNILLTYTYFLNA